MNDKKIYFWGGALLLLSLLLHSCQAIIPDDIGQEKKSTTYLQINMTGITMPRSTTRAQGNEPSINTDATDYEDYVGELAVLVYDASTGKQIKAQFSTTPSFVMELEAKEGAKYHFCFIANYPTSWRNTFEGLHSYNDLINKLKDTSLFWGTNSQELYDGATSTNFFPMARIYENQTVTKGGSFTAPKPFYPTVVPSGAGQLKPVSSFGDDYQSATSQKTVNLVRACAKIALNFRGLGAQSIASVKYNNVAADYTFMETPGEGSAGAEQTMTTSTFDPKKPDEPITARAYVPERLFDVAPTWDSRTTNGINYITITMKSGKVYEIPLITANNDLLATQDYMTIATSKGANYSIIRNHYYILDINIPQDGKELDIALKVMPWDLIESQMSYERPEYFLEIFKQANDGTYTTTPLTDINQEITLDDIRYGVVRGVQIRFKINAPIGAIWTATITNGRDFEMSRDVSGVINDGIVTGQGEWHTFTITPRNPFETEPRYAQFYITVEGKELYLGFKDDGKGNMIPDNRFISDGSSEKWQIKQIGRTIL